jgi:23S rRNA (adenine2503-C2)-methyltransferase
LNLLSLTYDELLAHIKSTYGKGDFHSRALYRRFFKEGKLELNQVSAFDKSGLLAQKLEDSIEIPNLEIVTTQNSDDVVKFVTKLIDDELIESVIIPSNNRITLCISSQVGCKMGCKFCTTAKMGFIRDLSVDEILWQVWATKFKFNTQIDNIVFMGMGEPLDNLDNVVKAVKILDEVHGFDIAQKNISISTSGDVAAIKKLGELGIPRIRLAVSLNAANDKLRDELMPINKRYPLKQLKASLKEFPLPRKGVFLIEYVLLKDVNDSVKDADEIFEFVKDLPVKVNLIPYNGNDGFTAPSEESVTEFMDYLSSKGVVVLKRYSRGDDISAACGQLSGKERS